MEHPERRRGRVLNQVYTDGGCEMSTNRGSWNVRAGMFTGAVVVVVWLVTAVAERMIGVDGYPGLPLTEAIARLHPGSYVLGAINGCVVGLLVAWPGLEGKSGSSKQDRGRTL